MLISLEIRNFVLIDKLKINFTSGFNVLTGETGAGKSIIISALELITGEKGSTRAVGSSGDKLFVVGTFNITYAHPFIKEHLISKSIDVSTNELVLKREITRDGKSRSFINNSSVRVADLKDLGDILVDIHGQHEHQSLFNPNHHLHYYDSFLNTIALREEYKQSYNKLLKLEKQYKEIMDNKNAIMKEKSFLTYVYEEIKKTEMEENEDEALTNQIYMMSNAEKINESLSTASKDLYGSTNGAYSKILKATQILSELASHDTRLEDITNQLEAISLNLDDIKPILSDILHKSNFNPAKLDSLNERLFTINTLKKKYGGSIKEILSYFNEIKDKLEVLNFSDGDIVNLKEDINTTSKEASRLAKQLSEKRHQLKIEFVSKIEKEMKDLGMGDTRFDIEITSEEDEEGLLEIDGKRYKASNTGIDNLEFIIAPNKNPIFMPLRKIASGGEISRIMLSLKTVLADGDYSETMVFDEIDTGVGGSIAEVIGQKIAMLSQKKQILAVTHLAQIAIYGDLHFKVIKEDREDSINSTIEQLSTDKRINEIARMIAGKEITSTTIEHAKEMLNSTKKNSERDF